MLQTGYKIQSHSLPEQHCLILVRTTPTRWNQSHQKALSQSLIHSDVHTRYQILNLGCVRGSELDRSWVVWLLQSWLDCLTERFNVKTVFIFTSVLNVGTKLHHSVRVKLKDPTKNTKGRFTFSYLKVSVSRFCSAFDKTPLFLVGFWNKVQDEATLETLPSCQTNIQNMRATF